MMGSITSIFSKQRTMNAIPKDLADLLQDQHRDVWVKKFRDFLDKLDKRTKQKPWRVNLLDFLLDCRELTMLEAKEVRARSRSPSRDKSDLQNICNDRDDKFSKLREKYFDGESPSKVGLTTTELWNKIANYNESGHTKKSWSHEENINLDESGSKIYGLAKQAMTDHNVWNKLDFLCNKFLKQTSVPTLAVLLSIL